jgi:hypothetical protein
MNTETGRIHRVDELSEPERARVVTLGDQATPLQSFAELVARMREAQAQGGVDPDEVARQYAEAAPPPSDEPAFAELTLTEANQLAAIPNEHARLKAFRKLRAKDRCNVCARFVGNHSDKQMATCFRRMADAVATRNASEAGARAARSVPAASIHQV